MDNPGAIHDNLQATEVCNRFLDRLAHLSLTCNVAFVEDSFAAVSGNTFDNFLTKFGLYVYDSNLRPLLCKELGGGFTHAGGTAADPSNLSFQSFRVVNTGRNFHKSCPLPNRSCDFHRTRLSEPKMMIGLFVLILYLTILGNLTFLYPYGIIKNMGILCLYLTQYQII